MKKEEKIEQKEKPKKSFFKRFWWIFLIVLILLIIFGIAAYSGYKHDKELSKENNDMLNLFNDNGNEYSKLDERVVASFFPESGAAFKYNSPTIVNDFIYVGTSSRLGMDDDPQKLYDAIPANYFYKMDLDLNVIWKYELGKTMVSGGATLDSEGNIYFTTETFAVNNNSEQILAAGKDEKKYLYLTTMRLVSLTNDGKLRWQKTISENDAWDHNMFNLAISTDDTIYFGHEKLYAYDTEGNMEWQYPTSDKKILGFSSSPVIDTAGNIYFVSPEPTNQEWGTETIRAYKFAPNSNGVPLWATELGNEVRLGEGPTKIGEKRVGDGLQRERNTPSSPALGLEEKSLYALVGCTVNKVDTATGHLLWSMKPENATGGFIASPAIDDKDNLYVGTKSNLESTFFAISSDGNLLWENHIGADLYNSPLLGDDGMIYVGSETTELGNYHKLDMTTGETKWVIGKQKSMSDFSVSSGALYKSYVYIGVHDKPSEEHPQKTFFKIKIDAYDYLPNATWPRFHGSNANNGRIN